MVAYPIVLLVFLQFSRINGFAVEYNVTLAVFSGMPDPEWTVPAKQISGLLAGAKTYDPEDMPGRLGFKGFVLQNGKTARLVVGAETKKLQLQLLQTMPKDVERLLQGDLIKLIRNEINTGVAKAETGPKKIKRRAPPYQPGPWQGLNFRRRICNNCYNYANNRPTNNYAQPGFGNAGHYPYPRNDQIRFGPAIIAAAQSDGLTLLNVGIHDPSPVDPGPNDNRHVVAVVAIPGTDFHWYRLDANGQWSHKPGQRPKNVDNLNLTITDPRHANRGAYSQFIGFMYSPDNVAISGPVNCCIKMLKYAFPCTG